MTSPGAETARCGECGAALAATGGVPVGTSRGFNHMLLESAGGWRTRQVDPGEEPVLIERDATGAERSRAPASEAYDPRLTTWFVEASGADVGAVRWTPPYRFATTQDPGITGAVRWQRGGESVVLALDVMLVDLSTLTDVMGADGTAAILTVDRRLLALPPGARFADRAVAARTVLSPIDYAGVPALAAALAEWERLESPRGPFVVPRKLGRWWAQVRVHHLGGQLRVLLLTAVPERAPAPGGP